LVTSLYGIDGNTTVRSFVAWDFKTEPRQLQERLPL
jgi:hypothetical protein